MTLLTISLLSCRSEPDGPPIELIVRSPRAEMSHARVLLTAFHFETSENWGLLVDGEGHIAWSREGTVEQRILRAKPSRDERAILYAMSDPHELQEIGTIVREPLDRSDLIVTSAPRIHHDFLEIDVDGEPGYAYLEHRFTEAPLGRFGVVPIAADSIRVTAQGAHSGGDVRFDLLDDYALPGGAPIAPWWTCEHMAFGDRIEGYHEWAHSNSLLEHPDGQSWLVMLRYLDALVRIDSQTGEVRYQLGGSDNTVLSLDEGTAFLHAHTSHTFTGPDGKTHILVFDNGEGHAPPRETSRVVELAIDDAAGTVERVWELADPTGAHTLFLGDARRLPGGNTLVAWGQHGRISEYTPQGELLWEIALPMAVGRITYWP